MMSRRACVKMLLILAVLVAQLNAQPSQQPTRTNTVDRGAINGAPFEPSSPTSIILSRTHSS
jgi:hypothetical protein